MEKKEPIKVSLSTFFLIISIIVIAVMGYFMFKLYNDKNIETGKTNELQKQVENLNGTINDLQGKMNNSTNLTNNSEKNTNSFSNDEIKKAIQDYLDLKGAVEGSPEGLLVKLGFMNYGDYTENTEDNYIKTKIKYSELKNKILNVMTEKWYQDNFSKFFKEINGNVYYWNVGATGMEYDVESITLKGGYSENSYIANVYYIYINDTKELKNIEFHITDYNGKCVIEYCD